MWERGLFGGVASEIRGVCHRVLVFDVDLGVSKTRSTTGTPHLDLCWSGLWLLWLSGGVRDVLGRQHVDALHLEQAVVGSPAAFATARFSLHHPTIRLSWPVFDSLGAYLWGVSGTRLLGRFLIPGLGKNTALVYSCL